MNKSQIVGGIDDDKILMRGLRDHSNDQQQSSQAQEAAKTVNVQLNLENLVKIEDKIASLVDNLRQSKFQSVSQLCSDWWELTDEDEYSVAKFEVSFNIIADLNLESIQG